MTYQISNRRREVVSKATTKQDLPHIVEWVRGKLVDKGFKTTVFVLGDRAMVVCSKNKVVEHLYVREV